MKAVFFLMFSLGGVLADSKVESVRKVRLPLPVELTRADIYTVPTISHPCAILVLCPGVNHDGKPLLTPAWSAYAVKNQLGLAALSFASNLEDLANEKGYYQPSRGSGQALLEGLHTIYGQDLPILLYGMSGGAHFIAGFLEWKPERVISWCAYTAAWWSKPSKAATNPPGIVACGDEDTRYGASLGYFLQGRAIGKPWTWVSLPRIGHQSSPALDDFVRVYFSAILHPEKHRPEWRDVDLKSLINDKEVKSHPTLASWLPDRVTAEKWMIIHQP
jgi:hypothetical protein